MITETSSFSPTDPWILVFQHKLIDWYTTVARDLPWRKTRDPYAIWISEIMLQQTQVDTVIPYYLRFMEAFPTLSDLAAAEDDILMKRWEGLGYYSRARNLKKAALLIQEQYQGQVPSDPVLLQKLPGIGQYTAGAIGSIAFGLPLPAVDGNVIRVYSRVLGISINADTTEGKKLFQSLGGRMVAPQDPSSYNQGVMELGALICSPANPGCIHCPVLSLCEGAQRGNPTDYPVKTAKTPSPMVPWAVTLYRQDNRIFLVPRAHATLLRGLWGFPMTPRGETSPLSVLLGTVKHVFTHQTWQMQVRLVTKSDGTDIQNLYPDGIWVTREELNALPLPKAFQKVLHLLEKADPLF